MSSNPSIQQTISNIAPADVSVPSGAAVGAEWFNSVTGKLYKRTVTGGTITWVESLISAPIAGNSVPNYTVAGSLTLGSLVTDNLKLNSYGSIKALSETAIILAIAPPATTTFNVLTESIRYYTANAANNTTLNITAGSSTVNSLLQIGQSLTIALLVTNGSVAYYPNSFQVDGSSVIPKWQGGVPITAGNATALDSYGITIIKTADATYTMLAAQTKYS